MIKFSLVSEVDGKSFFFCIMVIKALEITHRSYNLSALHFSGFLQLGLLNSSLLSCHNLTLALPSFTDDSLHAIEIQIILWSQF